MSFEFVPTSSAPRGGSARTPEVVRFVEALEVELAGEKIDLPSFPEVAARVRKALTNDQVDIDHVVQVVSAEPALAARLLQLANSAALNPSGKRLTDLRSSISRIGFNMARSATIAFAMSQLRRAEAYNGVEASLTELWQQLGARRGDQSRRGQVLHADQSRQRAARWPAAGRRPTLSTDAGRAFPRTAPGPGRLPARGRRMAWPHHAGNPAQLGSRRRNRRRDRRLRRARIASTRAPPTSTDVLAVGGALAALGCDPQPEDMLFLGMPAARRMKLDAVACVAALAESHIEIACLRQALGA